MDFPGGPAVENLPCSARDVGSTSGQGTKIPCATGQLSPEAATSESALSEDCALELESPCAMQGRAYMPQQINKLFLKMKILYL